jgi:hypothetical protein
MGIPSRDPEQVAPCPSPPPVQVEFVESVEPLACYHCRRGIAEVLPHSDQQLHPAIFCSVSCAVDFAQLRVETSNAKICDFCFQWSDDDGFCPACDSRVNVAVLDDLDRVFRLERGSKGGNHDA